MEPLFKVAQELEPALSKANSEAIRSQQVRWLESTCAIALVCLILICTLHASHVEP